MVYQVDHFGGHGTWQIKGLAANLRLVAMVPTSFSRWRSDCALLLPSQLHTGSKWE